MLDFDQPQGSRAPAQAGPSNINHGAQHTASTSRDAEDQDMDNATPSATSLPAPPAFTFTLSATSPAASSSTSPTAPTNKSAGTTRPLATPPRRRSGAPSSIPNFPSSTEARDPNARFTPSPSVSPGATSPFKSPATPSTPPSVPSRPSAFSLSGQGFQAMSAAATASSPWHALAASSGAPTPSLEGPGRSSPHLGGPFAKLNLEGSWSGANLWSQSAGSSRTASIETELSALGGNFTGGEARAGGSGAPAGLTGNMSAETLAKYRSMAGRASIAGRRGSVEPKSGQQAAVAMDGMEGAAASGSSDGTGTSPSKPPLPAALARRRASLPKVGLGNTLTTQTKSPSPLASHVASLESSPSGPALRPLSPNALPEVLARVSTLVLDVRPPSSFLSAHISSAHSLPVPSTLLRRPAFNLTKLTTMLSPASREAVKTWKQTSDIVLIDTDSVVAGEGSILEGLAGKFEREGYSGKVWFVRGGHNALGDVQGVKILEDRDGDQEQVNENVAMRSGPSMTSPTGNFMAGGLGSFAFYSGSTGDGRSSHRESMGSGTSPSSMRVETFASLGQVTERPLSLTAMSLSNASGSSIPLAGGSQSNAIANSSGRGSPTSSSSSLLLRAKMQPANPFFDNIRQNLELSHGGITERIPLQLPPEARRRAHEMPAWLSELVLLSESEAAERLAQQFYQLERNEQKRLQAVMDWHTRGSGAVLGSSKKVSGALDAKADKDRQAQAAQPPVQPSMGQVGDEGDAQTWEEQQRRDKGDIDRLEAWTLGKASPGGEEEYYPFSITAGLERGTKNRYKNIWPYDFSRVRLESPCEDQSDYINASHIQPRGTRRRFIATQGPLDATYRDFWTLVWEQNVRVIVMLTKQFEGGLLKCGNYWQDQHYGSLHLTLERHVGGEDAAPKAQTSGFDFGLPAPAPSTSKEDADEPVNIRREFVLRHDDDPVPRRIVQIQCIAWPDFDVPESPEILLALIRDVDTAMEELIPDKKVRAAGQSPVLVHCSAGVGRTGSYIVVDTILDALARDRRARTVPEVRAEAGTTSEAMQLDTPMERGSQPMAVPVPSRMPSDRDTWTKYRGRAEDQESSIGVGGGNGGGAGRVRRPSLLSAFTSEDRLSTELLPSVNEEPRSIAGPEEARRTPSPLSSMVHPILDVLESMRVQRMSLVQSLRQFVFVHRVIIHQYLAMIDEEASRERGMTKESSIDSEMSEHPVQSETSTSSLPHPVTASSSITTGTTASSASTAATSMGEAEPGGGDVTDGPPKRRASPTELQHDRPSLDDDRQMTVPMAPHEGGTPKKGASTVLGKRVSVKRMRQDVGAGGRSPAGSGSSTGTGGYSGSV